MIGTEPLTRGARIVNTHNDSVRLELKPSPLRESFDLVLLDTRAHGTLKNYQWVNRPLWRWPSLSGDTKLPGVAAPWDRPQAPVVFCEDVSRFLGPEHTRDFVIDDVPTSLPTRYVANPADSTVAELVGGDLSAVQYGPKTRFAL